MDPLPLIQRPSVKPERGEDGPVLSFRGGADVSDDDPDTLIWYGYAILWFTWIVFVVMVNTVFSVWKVVIGPLKESSPAVYMVLKKLFEVIDEYVMALYGIYVMLWWWALLSWSGLKLFRHSKGIQTNDLN